MKLASRLTGKAFKALRLLDVPDIVQHVAFGELRRRYYGLFWARLAAQAGATFQKWDDGFVRLSRGGTVLIARGPDLRFDDRLTLDLMGNKALTYKLMAEQGLAVPRHVRFHVSDMGPAIALLKSTGRPLVVKPNFGTGGGRGVTTGILTASALRRAALWAARFDADLVAETQVEGHNWRLLFIDGRFLDAVRRDPPRVVGDGIRTIRSLVRAENAGRLAAKPFTALSPIRLDRECLNYLASQRLNQYSVPAAGEVVVVKRAVNENSSAQNHSLSAGVHPATIARCAALVHTLGVRRAGIDIIARDISAPLEPENGIIGEINTTPGLHHHDLVAEPAAGRPPLAELINHMFETRAGALLLPGSVRPPPQLRVASA